MDTKAAEDYHKVLLLELRGNRPTFANMWWIPAMTVSGYFLFESTEGSIFGGLIGYGFCAVLTRLERIRRDIFRADFLKHLHEHTDEFERGEIRAGIEIDINNQLKKKWFD